MAGGSLHEGSSMKVLLEAKDLNVGYRTRQAQQIVLSDLSFQIDAGELICLLGPNGSGKSTLLRTLSGLQPALRGVVKVLGRDTDNYAPQVLAVVLTERPAEPSLLVEIS